MYSCVSHAAEINSYRKTLMPMAFTRTWASAPWRLLETQCLLEHWPRASCVTCYGIILNLLFTLILSINIVLFRNRELSMSALNVPVAMTYTSHTLAGTLTNLCCCKNLAFIQEPAFIRSFTVIAVIRDNCYFSFICQHLFVMCCFGNYF